MAVDEVFISDAGVTGSFTGTDPSQITASYRANYRAHCDSKTDMINQIFEKFRTDTTLPWFGRTYKVAGFDNFATCRSVEPSYVEKSDGWWNVAVSFETVAASLGEPKAIDINGKEQTNPLLWHEEIDIGYTQVSIPVEMATFRGTEPKGKVIRFLPEGKLTPVVNSALVEFDPGIEDELAIKVIRFTRYVQSYDGGMFDPYIGTVNNDDVVITKPAYNFKQSFSPYVGKIHNIGAVFAVSDGFRYYRLTTELHIDPRGYRRMLSDRGMSRRLTVGVGDKKRDGVELQQDDIIDGAGFPHREGLRDLEDFPIPEPVPFDGEGHPAAPGDPPVWLIYQVKEERPFMPLAGVLW